MEHTATYSPEDNKLRLYPACRLSAEDFAKVKAAGFKWAPKQELFVAPMWTPEREDLLLGMCEEIGDEDYSPEERAADRAERFGGYRDKRRAEAGGLADRFEAGPIAFGHQSHARAERQANRHDRLRTGAVSQWSKAEYWQHRTEGVIAAALYKSSAKVRRSRILRLEADMRRYRMGERWKAHYELRLTYERAMLAQEGGSAADEQMEVGGFFGSHQIWKVNKSPATGRVVSLGFWGAHPYRNNADGSPKMGIQTYNIERLPEGNYRAPTDEEREAFKVAQRAAKSEQKAKAPKVASLINPTMEDAERLQAAWNAKSKAQHDRRISYADYKPSEVLCMTQAQYSAVSKGTYSHYDTAEVCEHGQQPRREYGRNADASPVAFKVRKTYAGGGYTTGANRVIVITDKPQKALPLDWEEVMDYATGELVAN